MFKILSKNTKYWIYTFLAIFLLIWIFYQLFFSVSISENIPIYSYAKKGNRAFYEFLHEKDINISTVFTPAFHWAKQLLTKIDSQKVKEFDFEYKYVLVEKEADHFWSVPEKIWFKKWIESGQEMIIFTDKPLAYWEALTLPIDIIDREKIKKSHEFFPYGFEFAIESLVKEFLYDSLITSRKIPSISYDPKKIKTQSCSIPGKEKFYLVSPNPPYHRKLNDFIQKEGWEEIQSCREDYRMYSSAWKYKTGKITFISAKDILNNEYIALADNIVFLNEILDLSDKSVIIWDEYHHGIVQKPNLFYALFYTLYGKIFVWILVGLFIYFLINNHRIKKYPLPLKSDQISGASLIHFKLLTNGFKSKHIINDAWETFLECERLKGKDVPSLFVSKRLRMKQKYRVMIAKL